MKPSELLSSEDKWTKNCSARTIDGDITWTDDSKAYSFCLFGALNKCFDNNIDLYRKEYIKISNHLYNKSISQFNDAPETTYEDVMELLKKCDL